MNLKHLFEAQKYPKQCNRMQSRVLLKNWQSKVFFLLQPKCYYSIRITLSRYSIKTDGAIYMKKEFNKKCNPSRPCIGRSFGTYVTKQKKSFVYFYFGRVAIFMFKSTWIIFFKIVSVIKIKMMTWRTYWAFICW